MKLIIINSMLADNHGVKVHGFLGTVIKTPHATYATCGSQVFYSQMKTILLADVFFLPSPGYINIPFPSAL